MRLAFFTPLSPVKSGISNYSENLLPHLGKYFDIEIFIDGGYKPASGGITGKFEIRNAREFKKKAGSFDANLFQVGNHRFHSYMYNYIKEFSGFTVMHEFHLAGMVLHTASREKLALVREIVASGGTWNLAENIFRVNWNFDPYKFPLNEVVINSSKGIIVHNDFMRGEIRKIAPGKNVMKIHHGARPANLGKSTEESRKELGMEGFDFIICSFGFVHQQKRIPQILQAFKQFSTSHPNSLYVICGEAEETYNLKKNIEELGLRENVLATGFVPMGQALNFINASDLGFNLRWPSTMATSGSLLHILSVGKPCAVTDVEEYREFPDSCTIKVPYGEGETEKILEVMERFYENRALGSKMGKNALEFVKECSWENAAKEYAKFIQENC